MYSISAIFIKFLIAQSHLSVFSHPQAAPTPRLERGWPLCRRVSYELLTRWPASSAVKRGGGNREYKDNPNWLSSISGIVLSGVTES